MKLFSGSSGIKENEPLSENASKLLEEPKEGLLPPNVRGEEALPIVQLDFIDALEKLHPGFLEMYSSYRSGHDIDRVLLITGLFYRLLGHTSVLRSLFYAGYLQGQKDERKRMDNLFGEAK